jgi:maltose/moltooligosaccharide transporter
MKTKFSWTQVILVALIPAMWEMMWALYNNYVPIYLQAGNPNFNMGEVGIVLGFGFGPAITGLLLTMDNIGSLFISPLVGIFSDTVRTRFGRRKPFILISTLISAIAFAFIPVIPGLIPSHSNGNNSELSGLLVLFLGVLFFVLIPMAIMKIPAEVLIMDITPSEKRTNAQSVFIFMAVLFGIIAALGGSILFNIQQALPFWIVSILAIATAILVQVKVKEPEEIENQPESERMTFKKLINIFRMLPKDNMTSLLLLLGSAFLCQMGISQVQAFMSSYAVTVLKIDAGSAGMLIAIPAIAMLIMALPAGVIGNKIGRKKARAIGLTIAGLAFGVLYFLTNQTLVIVTIVIAGLFWTFHNTMLFPMILDSAPNDRMKGTYAAILGIAETLAYILGPTLGGSVVQFFNSDYRVMWPMIAVFFILAVLIQIPAKKGEAKPALATD